MSTTNVISQNYSDSHQAQPRCVIKFITFRDRDSFYESDSSNSTTAHVKHNFNKDAVRPYTIVSDVLSANISQSKSSPITSGELTLSSGDLNYMSILAPGDHCLVWMLNDEAKYEEIVEKVKVNTKANDFNSGLKFVGRVNSVRAVYGIAPNGVKTLRYLVTLKGFSELQSMIYYNKLLYRPGENGGTVPGANSITGDISQILSGFRFFARISTAWSNLIDSNNARGLNPSDLMDFFINTFLGASSINVNAEVETIEAPNSAFVIPSIVAKILGTSTSASASVRYVDVLKSFIGIQKYSSNDAMIPTNLENSKISYINRCKSPLTGAYMSLPDSFSGQSIWQIMSNHLNSYINEMYVSVKAANSNGDIFPTFVARQIPFTSNKYVRSKTSQNVNQVQPASTTPGSQVYTRFAEITRWKVDPKYPINSFNFGTSDSLRFNFVQIFGALLGYDNQDASTRMQAQIVKENFTIDPIDISRNGARIQVLQTNLDILQNANAFDLSSWAALIGDFYQNGHLKMTGTLSLPGVQLPVSIGDNLELDGKLFHIESVSHTYQVDESSGMKTFVTNFQLSNGVLADKYDNYVMLQPHLRANMPDTIQPGYSDSEILSTGTKIESSSGNN